MDELFENDLGLAAALFVAACVLGVLWGKDGAGHPVKTVGDRVACVHDKVRNVDACLTHASSRTLGRH